MSCPFDTTTTKNTNAEFDPAHQSIEIIECYSAQYISFSLHRMRCMRVCACANKKGTTTNFYCSMTFGGLTHGQNGIHADVCMCICRNIYWYLLWFVEMLSIDLAWSQITRWTKLRMKQNVKLAKSMDYFYRTLSAYKIHQFISDK